MKGNKRIHLNRSKHQIFFSACPCPTVFVNACPTQSFKCKLQFPEGQEEKTLNQCCFQPNMHLKQIGTMLLNQMNFSEESVSMLWLSQNYQLTMTSCSGKIERCRSRAKAIMAVFNLLSTDQLPNSVPDLISSKY